MKKVKIFKPSKTAMQSGKRNTKKWILEFDSKNTGINPLMGWESSIDTLSEIRLEFETKDQAIKYAKKNNITLPNRNRQLQKVCGDDETIDPLDE